MYMLIILIFVDSMILLNLSLLIFAAAVAVEVNAMKNLQMMVVMNLVMMVLKIMMKK